MAVDPPTLAVTSSSKFNLVRSATVTEKKRAWKKPTLIVLIRCKSEERVLQGCKIGADPGPMSLCDAFSCHEGASS